MARAVRRAKAVIAVIAVAMTATIGASATAQADSVSPNCIPTLSTPVTLQLGGITSPLDLQVFFLHHSLALAFPTQPPAIIAPTLSNERFTSTGFSATAVFDNPVSGPPTASGLGEVIELTVGPGVVEVTPIGSLIVSPSCAPSPHPTSTGVSCSPSTAVAGGSTTCTATVSDTAASGQTAPGGTVSFTTGGPGSFAGGGRCALAAAPGAGSARCSVSYSPTATTNDPTRADTLTAAYGGDSSHRTSNGTAQLTVISPTPLATGSFVIGDQNAAVGTKITFGGPRWSALNGLSGGRAPASFKGSPARRPTTRRGAGIHGPAGRAAAQSSPPSCPSTSR